MKNFQQDAGTSDDSGRASERLTASSVAQRDAESSRDRLSDVSLPSLVILLLGTNINVNFLFFLSTGQ